MSAERRHDWRHQSVILAARNILLYVPKQVGERITSKNIEMSQNVVYFQGIEPTQAVLFMVWFVTMIYLKT